ncbi:5-formyltetrahydrofolate cyclo-ligase [Bordetella ansorpii]|uniref:5-formyltetrahydrofolate cyclo-ligase n=2 Tax=Bordetella ansorpii TaxID=288768 RepID=A0A157QZG5_9BORD|nr:5-formyltetrahydrofolate cyclo-ligase [Bordetella ansorpii]
MPEAARSRGGLLLRGRLFSWFNAARDAAIASGRRLQSVAAYWPMADEPDLRPLLEQWVEAGVQVSLPRIAALGKPLEFRNWTPGTPLREGHFGIPESDGDLCKPDIILVPTLGYTDTADRLGYGGGYYDRTLAALTSAGHDYVTIGIAWTEGRLPPDYRAAPHDVPLDAILTPDGWLPSAPLGAAPAAGINAGSQFILR